jgi:sugar phosphate permease
MLRDRRRWVVASLVLVISAVAYVDRVNLSVAAPVLTKQFHTNAAVMGLLLSSFTWSYTLLNVPAGMLVVRVRTRFVYSGALLLWGVASFLTVLVNSVGALFGPRLLLGVGEAPFIPAAVRTLSDWLPRSERGTGGGVFISGVALGSAIGPPILAALVSGYGWRSCFIATGTLSIVVAFGWFAWYRHPADDRKLSAEERELILADQEPYRPEGRAPWSTLIRNRDIWAITGGYFCLLYIQYTFVSWVPSYLVQDRHMTVLKSGLATSIPWSCAFLVAVLGGRISDILMRRGWSALNARKIVLVGGMVAALAIVGTAFSASAAIVFLSISTSGIVLANGAAWAATQDVTRRLNLPGSASGFINGMSNVGGILGPIVTGALVYATSTFVAPLVVSAAVALIGGLAWLLGIRPRSEPAAATDELAAIGGVTSTIRPRVAFGNRRVALGAAVAVVGGLSAAGLAVYPAIRAAQGTPPPLRDHSAAQTPSHALPGPDQPALNPAPGPVPWAGPLDAQPLVGPVINVAPVAPTTRLATAAIHDVRPTGSAGYTTDDRSDRPGEDGHGSGDDGGDLAHPDGRHGDGDHGAGGGHRAGDGQPGGGQRHGRGDGGNHDSGGHGSGHHGSGGGHGR